MHTDFETGYMPWHPGVEMWGFCWDVTQTQTKSIIRFMRHHLLMYLYTIFPIAQVLSDISAFPSWLGFLVCFLNHLGLARRLTPGRHHKAEVSSLPNPNQLYTKIFIQPRTTSHTLQIGRAERNPRKLHRQMTANYCEVPLGHCAGFLTEPALSDPLPLNLASLYLK